jgi:hypothetical protein
MDLGICNLDRIKAFLIFFLAGGIGGVIIDVDHIPNQWELWELSRPLHYPALVLGIFLVGYHLARVRRLLA